MTTPGTNHDQEAEASIASRHYTQGGERGANRVSRETDDIDEANRLLRSRSYEITRQHARIERLESQVVKLRELCSRASAILEPHQDRFEHELGHELYVAACEPIP